MTYTSTMINRSYIDPGVIGSLTIITHLTLSFSIDLLSVWSYFLVLHRHQLQHHQVVEPADVQGDKMPAANSTKS